MVGIVLFAPPRADFHVRGPKPGREPHRLSGPEQHECFPPAPHATGMVGAQMPLPIAVYVDVSNSGLPLWQVVPLTFLGAMPS